MQATCEVFKNTEDRLSCHGHAIDNTPKPGVLRNNETSHSEDSTNDIQSQTGKGTPNHLAILVEKQKAVYFRADHSGSAV
jgi:hypothetical protein